MPPFAHGLDSVSGVAAQEQSTVPDLGQVSNVELSRSPRFTNFFKVNEFKEQLASPAQMVELLQTAQRLHEMGSQALRSMAERSIWNRIMPTTVEGAHDLALHFKSKPSDANLKIAVKGEDDRKQLGMLLSIPVSPCDRYSTVGLVRKRSLSSILESEDLDEASLRRSCTSSESDPGAGDETHVSAHAGAARINPLKVQKTERLTSSGIDKDLLSLSLPVSNASLYSEISSSSTKRGCNQLLTKSDKYSYSPFRHCKVNPPAETDNYVAESDMLNASMISSISCNCHDQSEEHRTCRANHDHDDAPGDTSTCTHSSTEPSSPAVIVHGVDQQAVQLTLQLDSPKPMHMPRTGTHEAKRAKLQPLRELDAAVLRQNSLLLRDIDTGLETQGSQLVQLLLKCADATAKQNVQLAARILGELYQGVSLYGDSMQRVAAYFAEGLAARIISKASHLYSTLMIQVSNEEYFSAFTTLYKVTPYFQFAHFTANQAILEALEGHSVVHVIDLDIMQGFQWPSLIQALASRPGGPPHLRITGVGRYANIVRETGRRLTSFAASFDVPFEFQFVVEEKLENLTAETLVPRIGEAIVVNSILQLHRLLNPTSGENLHKVMHTLCRKLNPCVVTLVEQEANHNTPSFLGRFKEALHYYAAVFDSLDESLPQQNEERVKIEHLFFAQQIKNIVVCDGDDRIERHETFDLWQQRMETAGFIQVPLSAHAVSQAKLLLQFCPCEGYRLHERNGSISLGWQERKILTASAWSC